MNILIFLGLNNGLICVQNLQYFKFIKMKILYIHHGVGWGGAPKNLINIINSLDRSKYQPHVLLLKDSVVSQKLKENNIPFSVAKSFYYRKLYRYFVHSEAGYVQWFNFLKLIKLTLHWFLSNLYFSKRELKVFSPDIIHLNSSVLTDWLKPASCNAKVVIHIQEPFRKGKYDLIYVLLRRQMSKYADCIVAISNDNAKRIGLPLKTKVIFNTADMPDSPVDVNSYNSRKILYLGGAATIKGFYTLVDALEFIDKDIQILVGGAIENSKISDSGMKDKVKKYIIYILSFVIRSYNKRKKAVEKLKSYNNVEILGMISNVDQKLDEVCCLISPFSTPHFSRPVIEAQLHRKAVIATDVQGMEEIVFHKQNGLLVPVDNALKLADAINFICKNPIDARQMGESGFNFAKEHFTQTNIFEFSAIYDNLTRN